MARVTWKESYRPKLQLTANVQQRCSGCGMWLPAGSKPGGTHWVLFGPWCDAAPRPTARKRYYQSAHVGGWWFKPAELPADIQAVLAELAARAKREGRTLYARPYADPPYLTPPPADDTGSTARGMTARDGT